MSCEKTLRTDFEQIGYIFQNKWGYLHCQQLSKMVYSQSVRRGCVPTGLMIYTNLLYKTRNTYTTTIIGTPTYILLYLQVASPVNIASNYLNASQEAKCWGTAHASIVSYQVHVGHVVIG